MNPNLISLAELTANTVPGVAVLQCRCTCRGISHVPEPAAADACEHSADAKTEDLVNICKCFNAL
jgi:hypothetical protein